ncbi:hypothetical protein L1987_65066 [Smallanthus sonchifolius]|uniref:Uncharacterized protein n=1 Tax=Smallanthus sonchifolius TaxID=185202 RepID=A0ACB9BTF8_9ASTR|nr:hypothetical protein L1987_65066 [Smallanthus sonchifolius]
MDDKDVQEEPDQVSESKPEEESEAEPVGDVEGPNSDTNSRETVSYSVIHREETSSEEVRPPTPSPPRSPSSVPLRSEWVNFMGLVRRRTAVNRPPKKWALPLPDPVPLPKEYSHLVRPREAGSIE